MGQIQFPENKAFKGPWLISRGDLENLSVIIDEINSLLLQSWKNKIEQEAQQESPNSTEEELAAKISKKENSLFEDKHSIECQFTSKDGTKLTDDSINGLLRDNSLSTLSPEELHVAIVHGSYYNNNFDLRLSRRFDGELNYEIKCFNPNLKEEIQYKIDTWIEDNQPRKIVRIWSQYGDLMSYLLFTPIFILLGLTLTKSYSSYGEVMWKQSHEIIEHGIDSTNIYDAIDLLLKSESGYIPKDFIKQDKPRDPIFFRLLLMGIFIFIVGIIKPKTVMGVGKMKGKYAFNLFWIKLVTLTLPTALILVPFWTLTDWLF